jgi:hypothetical protein
VDDLYAPTATDTCHLARGIGVRHASEMNGKAELTVAATVDDIHAEA